MEDPLTGLPNRRQFDAALQAAIAAPPRAGASHAVLALDLNGFKKINDVHGHGTGDAVLSEVAGLLRLAVREGDLVARLGGDEFAVLARQLASPEAATSIARRIIEAMEQPLLTAFGEHRVGAAIGIALSPQDGSTAEELMRKADIALYRAKSEGGSALRFFEAEMDAQVQERDSLERELRAAIGTPMLRPYYQPQIDLKSGKIMGFEALARWTHLTLGEIPPDRFIPIADDCGLIGPLTDDLLHRACVDAMTWPKETLLSFNISPVQLRDTGLGLRLLAILGETGLAPQRLEIELTESALVRDMDGAREILGSIRDAGVKIALDDFGTGYSSLYHLRNFKLDKIKIDRSFVDTMGHDADLGGDREGARRPGRGPEPHGHRRGGGGRPATRHADRQRLRAGPGIPVQPRGAGRRSATPAQRTADGPLRLEQSRSCESGRSGATPRRAGAPRSSAVNAAVSAG